MLLLLHLALLKYTTWPRMDTVGEIRGFRGIPPYGTVQHIA
jgi:hypothetical protein